MTENEVEKFENFDLICICYEKRVDLKRFLEEYSQYLPRFIPKLSVRTKVDIRSNYSREENIPEIRELYGISSIAEISAKEGDYKDLLRGIIDVLENP